MNFPLFVLQRLIKSKKESNFFSFFSIISIGGIALGVTILIMALSILYGFENTIEEKIIEFTSHITISGFGDRNLEFSRAEMDSLKKLGTPYVKSIVPYIEKNAVIKRRKFSEGIKIEGLRKEFIKRRFAKFVVQGSLKNFGKRKAEIIIGEKLAEKLFAKVGDRVTIFTLRGDKPPSLENPPAIENFTIAAIYNSGMAEYDDLIAYADLETIQKVTALKGKVSGYFIQLNNLKKLKNVVGKLQDYLGYPYYVRSFYKTHQNIFTWLELQKKPVPLVLGLIILVAAFNIVGTLLMNILKQSETIGILRALGASGKKVARIFLAQGFFYAIVGILIGNALALALSVAQIKFSLVKLPASIYFISKAPIYFDARIYLIVSAAAFVVAFLASYIPAKLAAKINPIKAIRFR